MTQAVAATAKNRESIITGMNGAPLALVATAKGDIDLTVVLNPAAWGRLGGDVMNRYLKGKRPKQKVYIKHIMAERATRHEIHAAQKEKSSAEG